MGNRFKDKRWKKFANKVYDKLIKENRYSKYLEFGDMDYEEKLALQILVVSDLGYRVQIHANAKSDDVINLFSKFFECDFEEYERPGFPDKFYKWTKRGVDADQIRENIRDFKDCPTSNKLGCALKENVMNGRFIERHLKGNKYLYIANGYKKYIRNRKFTTS